MHGTARTSEVLDNIKAQGYKYSTKSGITVAVCDADHPAGKKEILADAEEQVDKISAQFQRGLYLQRRSATRACHLKIWEKATNDVTRADSAKRLDHYNPIYMMADSGARGSDEPDPAAGRYARLDCQHLPARTIEIPIRANYREGLNVLEYFISSRGARKGLADTALRTADSGYLTRRLVDVSQDVIIREEDCHCTDGLEIYDIKDGNEMIEGLTERLTGRYPGGGSRRRKDRRGLS